MRLFMICSMLCAASFSQAGYAQTQINSAKGDAPIRSAAAVQRGAFAHIADGGGWTTTFYLSNLDSTRSTPFAMYFVGSQGTALSLTTRTAHDGITRTTTNLTGTIAPASTITVETLGGPSEPSVGWVDVQGNSSNPFYGFSGYAVFRQRVPGRTDLEATVPLEHWNRSAFAAAFDNRNGFAHGIAVVNANNQMQAEIVVRLIAEDGSTLGTDLLLLPPLGHTSFVLTDRYPVLRNRVAAVEMEGRMGVEPITGIFLRFSPAGTMTTVPVFTTN